MRQKINRRAFLAQALATGWSIVMAGLGKPATARPSAPSAPSIPQVPALMRYEPPAFDGYALVSPDWFIVTRYHYYIYEYHRTGLMPPTLEKGMTLELTAHYRTHRNNRDDIQIELSQGHHRIGVLAHGEVAPVEELMRNRIPLVARIEHLVDYEMPPEIKRVEGIRVMVYRPV